MSWDPVILNNTAKEFIDTSEIPGGTSHNRQIIRDAVNGQFITFCLVERWAADQLQVNDVQFIPEDYMNVTATLYSEFTQLYTRDMVGPAVHGNMSSNQTLFERMTSILLRMRNCGGDVNCPICEPVHKNEVVGHTEGCPLMCIQDDLRKLKDLKVSPAGFEPATSRPPVERSNQTEPRAVFDGNKPLTLENVSKEIEEHNKTCDWSMSCGRCMALHDCMNEVERQTEPRAAKTWTCIECSAIVEDSINICKTCWDRFAGY